MKCLFAARDSCIRLGSGATIVDSIDLTEAVLDGLQIKPGLETSYVSSMAWQCHLFSGQTSQVALNLLVTHTYTGSWMERFLISVLRSRIFISFERPQFEKIDIFDMNPIFMHVRALSETAHRVKEQFTQGSPRVPSFTPHQGV